MDDTVWMQQAMQEAAKAGWNAHPNPMVGAVIVRDGIELGRGHHHAAGQPHAEIEALRDAARRGYTDVSGASIYVTLEPCNHFGRTPPCTEALIRAGIARCIIGTPDTDARVHGAGIRRLRDAGIECSVGFCQDELIRLNAAFFTRTKLGRPYITAKWAMTADGFTATKTGSSQWITGTEARRDVHEFRQKNDAIMAGTQTVMLDDPQLNVRLPGASRQPVRIILDRTLRIPISARVFDTSNQKTVLFTAQKSENLGPWQQKSIHTETVRQDENGLDIPQILSILAEKYQITTLYCEGGAAILGTLCDLDLIDECHIYIAPKIIGGRDARPCIAGRGIEKMADARSFRFDEPKIIGNDLRITAKIDHIGHIFEQNDG